MNNKTILLTALLAAVSANTNAQDKFSTLAEHLPKKGVPTELQLKYEGGIPVINENFILAESDKYFFEQQEYSGINNFEHDKNLTTPESQTVVRQNRDTLYSKGVFDTAGGAKFELPIHDTYQSMQIIDEQHRTVAVLYAEIGKNKITVTPDMLSSGDHVWIVIRTQVKSMAESDLNVGRLKQHMVKATVASAYPYVAKGFDQQSRENIRIAEEKNILKVDFVEAFGAPGSERVKSFDARVATAMGFGGLPSEHAYYKVLLAEDRSGTCQTMTFEQPPLQEKGFFSITTYGPDAYIHAYNYATSSREIKPNNDGTITVNFNCEGAINNLDVLAGWTGVLRMYMPQDLNEIVEYAKTVKMPHSI
ncbi:DUF1254 domain-containing protein (plasmid) [Photobacterium sp. DA100]|uniref:DUF1254 domain-containing protein n=1 Tax=Photobacterium sp. DA100 TaxID=3027472 RepID=UPI00247B1B5C|nr:DUF1254 domain-containing protein [Photobacterium sp. DA100]WEM45366.1 DUF1254 domain-containing protein [Photobacterium sp. DA100]